MKKPLPIFEIVASFLVGLILFVAPSAFGQIASVDISGDIPNLNWDGDAFDSPHVTCPMISGTAIEMLQADEYKSMRYQVPAAFQGNDSVIYVPFSAYQNTIGGNSYPKVNLFEYNAAGTLYERNIHTSYQTYDVWVTHDTTTNPAPYRTLQSDTVEFEIEVATRFGGTCVDLVGPVRFTNVNVDCTSVDCSDPNSAVEETTVTDNSDIIDAIASIDYGNPLEWSFDDGSSDIDFDEAVDALDAFICGDPFEFIAQKAGGGNLLKKILGFIKSIAASQLGIQEGSAALNCKADVANDLSIENNEINMDIYQGQTQVTNLPPNASFAGSTWNIDNGSGRTASEAADDTIASLESGIESDNVITAAARTNRLLVANVRMQAQLSDRLLGPSDRSPYASENGPLLTAAELDVESGADFAEGDYQGTRDRVSDYGATIAPDYDELVVTEDADAEFVGTGSCLAASAEIPTGEGSELAFATMKWNASQRLAKSNMGNFICSIIDQPSRSTQTICLGSADGFSTSALSSAGSLSNGNFCVYGPDAPAFSNMMFNSLPIILLMFASLSVFKMFFN